MQDLFANAPPIYSTEEELGVDKLDIKESRWNGVKVLGEVLVEALMEEEGEALINWLAKEFGDEFPLIKKFSKAYDSLEMGDGIKELYQQYLAEILNDLEKEKEQEREQKYENYNALMLKQMELEAAVTMGGEYTKRYDKFGTISDLGVVAINYENTRELIRIIDAMDNLVTGKIIPEMEDIAEDLRRMRYWKVDVRRWTDIRDAIEESNNRRKKLRERLMHYYNACESMESRFVERMGQALNNVDVMIPIG